MGNINQTQAIMYAVWLAGAAAPVNSEYFYSNYYTVTDCTAPHYQDVTLGLTLSLIILDGELLTSHLPPGFTSVNKIPEL